MNASLSSKRNGELSHILNEVPFHVMYVAIFFIIFGISPGIIGMSGFDFTSAERNVYGDDASDAAAVASALKDPWFRQSANLAGYEVDDLIIPKGNFIAARCTLKSPEGKSRCDPFPTGWYTTIPGNGTVRVMIQP